MNEYSLSLFTLGKEENLLDVFYDEIKVLLNVFEEERVTCFLENKFIKIDDKKDVINKVLKDVNKYLVNFINLVIDDRKEDNLLEMFANFNELYYKEKNIVVGTVYGLEIDENRIKILEDVYSKKMNKKVVLMFKQDLELIGGYKVIVDNKLYDNSYKSKLNNLKKKLLEEGEFND
jgi:F-type H+-transporting ATPase subunit delta